MLVYLITNTVNGMRYVGQTARTLDARWWQHCHKKQTNCHYLHRAIQKYGKESFFVEVLCELPNEQITDEMEEYFINRYCTLAPNGYNLMTGGRAPRHNELTRKKMSASHKGIRPPTSFAENWTPEWRARASERSKGSRNSNAKLTNQQVEEIRSLYREGNHSQQKLANMYGVHQAHISRLVLNKQFVN